MGKGQKSQRHHEDDAGEAEASFKVSHQFGMPPTQAASPPDEKNSTISRGKHLTRSAEARFRPSPADLAPDLTAHPSPDPPFHRSLPRRGSRKVAGGGGALATTPPVRFATIMACRRYAGRRFHSQASILQSASPPSWSFSRGGSSEGRGVPRPSPPLTAALSLFVYHLGFKI